MIEKDLEIINKLGLHARAAAKLVSCTGRYQSRVLVARDGREVNGKSIMGVMMLAANKGSRIHIKADGPDEQEVAQAIEALVRQRFGEDE
jgi:phosphocarrier protein HPr